MVYTKGLDIELFKDLKIPIPKSEDKMIEWVDKISEPYNNVIENKNKLKELEEQVKQDIQNMIDSNECDDVKLGDLCEFANKKNKYLASDGKKSGKYRFYTSSQTKILYMDTYEFLDYHILIGRGGNVSIHYSNKFSVSHDDVYVLKCVNNINLRYIFYNLYLNKNSIIFEGSTIKHSSKSSLKEIKIKIPKDKSLIDSLNPTFNEIDSLNEEIPKQEKLYQQYLNELKSEAIKED